MGINSMI